VVTKHVSTISITTSHRALLASASLGFFHETFCQPHTHSWIPDHTSTQVSPLRRQELDNRCYWAVSQGTQ